MAAQWRDSDVFARLVFNGLDLVSPGVVLTSEWRNDDPEPHPTPAAALPPARVECPGAAC
jgi:hypothetical protein